VTLALNRFARLALTASAFMLVLPLAHSEARSSKHLQISNVTIALPSNGEVTDFSSRSRHRHVRHVSAHRKHYVSRRLSRRSRVAAATVVSPFGFFAANTAYASPQTEAVLANRSRRSRGPLTPAPASFGGYGVVSEARRYIGGNPTGRGRAWCAAFMNMVLERTGHRGSGSNLAWSFARYGQRVSGPQVGAIAVMGHHVGVVSGVDARGNPIIISGNYQRRVAEAVYPRGRIATYVMPM
jgi:uncharacterized protein (TIGR02594 family)